MARKTAYYDALAPGYDRLHGEEQDRKYALILKNLRIDPQDRVLDVGCGTGRFLALLPAAAQGIDPSPGLLKQVPERNQGRVRIGAAESLPFPDHSFDVVVSVTALQNMDDPAKAIAEMKRVGSARYAISFLKRSPKRERLLRLLARAFPHGELIEDSQDILLIDQG